METIDSYLTSCPECNQEYCVFTKKLKKMICGICGATFYAGSPSIVEETIKNAYTCSCGAKLKLFDGETQKIMCGSCGQSATYVQVQSVKLNSQIRLITKSLNVNAVIKNMLRWMSSYKLAARDILDNFLVDEHIGVYFVPIRVYTGAFSSPWTISSSSKSRSTNRPSEEGQCYGRYQIAFPVCGIMNTSISKFISSQITPAVTLKYIQEEKIDFLTASSDPAYKKNLNGDYKITIQDFNPIYQYPTSAYPLSSMYYNNLLDGVSLMLENEVAKEDREEIMDSILIESLQRDLSQHITHSSSINFDEVSISDNKNSKVIFYPFLISTLRRKDETFAVAADLFKEGTAEGNVPLDEKALKEIRRNNLLTIGSTISIWIIITLITIHYLGNSFFTVLIIFCTFFAGLIIGGTKCGNAKEKKINYLQQIITNKLDQAYTMNDLMNDSADQTVARETKSTFIKPILNRLKDKAARKAGNYELFRDEQS